MASGGFAASGSSWLERSASAARSALYGTLYLANKQSSPGRASTLIMQGVAAFQIVSDGRLWWTWRPKCCRFVAFVGKASFDGANADRLLLDALGTTSFTVTDTLSVAVSALGVFSVSGLSALIGSAVYFTTFCVATLWMTLFTFLTITIGRNVHLKSPQSKVKLHLYRGVARLSAVVLFIPCVSLGLSWLTCNSSLNDMNMCWGALHISGIVLVCLVTPVFIVLAIATQNVLISRDLVHGSITSRIDSRAEVNLLLSKVMLMAAATLLPREVWYVGAALQTGTSVLWLRAYVLRQPFHTPWMNEWQGALAGIFAWLVFGMLLSSLLGLGLFGLSILLLGCGSAAAACVLAVRAYRASVAATPLSELRTSDRISLWARARITAFTVLQSGSGQQTQLSQRDAPPQLHAGQTSADAEQDDAPKSLTSAPLQTFLSIMYRGVVDSATQLQDAHYRRLHDTLRSEATAGFHANVAKFPDDGRFQLQLADFIRGINGSRYMELTALGLAKQHSSAFDIQFFVYQRTRELRESIGTGQSGKGTMSPVDRLMIDQHASQALKCELRVRELFVRLWEDLNVARPDMSGLARLGNKIQDAIKLTEAHYTQVIKAQKQNVGSLRRYGTFVAEVLGQNNKGQEILAKAERLEETLSGRYSRFITSFTCFQATRDVSMVKELAAVVRLSGEPGPTLGEVVRVNSLAASLFARSPADMVGMPFGELLPPPINSLILSALQQYVELGNDQVLDKTIFVLVRDALNRLVPSRFSLREAPPEEDEMGANFLCIFQQVESNLGYMLLSIVDGRPLLFSACPASYRLLGIEAIRDEHEITDMSQFIPKLSSVWAEQCSACNPADEGHGDASQPAGAGAEWTPNPTSTFRESPVINIEVFAKSDSGNTSMMQQAQPMEQGPPKSISATLQWPVGATDSEHPSIVLVWNERSDASSTKAALATKSMGLLSPSHVQRLPPQTAGGALITKSSSQYGSAFFTTPAGPLALKAPNDTQMTVSSLQGAILPAVSPVAAPASRSDGNPDEPHSRTSLGLRHSKERGASSDSLDLLDSSPSANCDSKLSPQALTSAVQQSTNLPQVIPPGKHSQQGDLHVTTAAVQSQSWKNNTQSAVLSQSWKNDTHSVADSSGSGPFSDSRSESSGVSRASAAIATRSILLKHLKDSNSTDPTIKQIALGLRSTLFISISLAGIVLFGVDLFARMTTKRVLSLVHAGRALRLVEAATVSTTLLNLHQSGVQLFELGHTFASLQADTIELQREWKEIIADSDELDTMGQRSGDGGMQKLLDLTHVNGEPWQATLYAAVNAVIANLEIILAGGVSAASLDNPSFQFIARNVPEVLVAQMNQTILLRQEQSSAFMTEVNQYMFIVAGVSMSLLGLALGIFLAQRVRKVGGLREQPLAVLFSIPKPHIANLHKHSKLKLESFKEHIGQEHEDIDDDDSDAENADNQSSDGSTTNRAAMQALDAGSSSSGSVGKSAASVWTSFTSKAATRVSSTVGVRRVLDKGHFRVRFLSVFMLQVFLCVLWLSITLILLMGSQRDLSSDVRRLYLTQQVSSQSMKVAQGASLAVVLPPGNSRNASMRDLDSALMYTFDQVSGLLQGSMPGYDPESAIDPLPTTSPAFALFSEDVCPLLQKYDQLPTNCTTFDDGLLTLGLSVVLQRYLQQGQLLSKAVTSTDGKLADILVRAAQAQAGSNATTTPKPHENGVSGDALLYSFTDLVHIEDPYLRGAMRALESIFVEHIYSIEDDALQWSIATNSVFLALSLALHLLVHMPHIASMQAKVDGARSLLVGVPNEYLARHKAFSKIYKRFMGRLASQTSRS